MATAKRLPSGDYRIQFVGAPTPEYATSNGLQKAVTVAPGTPPSVVERQIVSPFNYLCCSIYIIFHSGEFCKEDQHMSLRLRSI